jgi:choline dehydrogenase-like flavoprotein
MPGPLAAAGDATGDEDLPLASYDVVVCGGTLGIFLAAALAREGHRVAVVEAGPLRGRAQEWNISRKELDELKEVGRRVGWWWGGWRKVFLGQAGVGLGQAVVGPSAVRARSSAAPGARRDA